MNKLLAFNILKLLSQEIKSKGMKVWLTVHYSDTRADTGHQQKPAAWAAANFIQVKDSVASFTKKIAQEINPDYIQIGNETNDANYFFNTLSSVDYDIMAVSYYPTWHGKGLNVLKTSLYSLTSTFNKALVIAETAYPFSVGFNDYTNNINSIVNENNRGLGFCYWGTKWISMYGSTATNGSTWENLALWDFNNNAVSAIEIFKN